MRKFVEYVCIGFDAGLLHHICTIYMSAIMTKKYLPAIAALALAACSSHHVDDADLAAVRQAGVDRALELASGTQTSTDTMKMEVALIDFRSREQRMRDEGYPDAADAFVDAFIATLDSVNPSLAAELK